MLVLPASKRLVPPPFVQKYTWKSTADGSVFVQASRKLRGGRLVRTMIAGNAGKAGDAAKVGVHKLRPNNKATFASVIFKTRPHRAVIANVFNDFRREGAENDDPRAALPVVKQLRESIAVSMKRGQVSEIDGLRNERTMQDQICVADFSDGPIVGRLGRARNQEAASDWCAIGSRLLLECFFSGNAFGSTGSCVAKLFFSAAANSTGAGADDFFSLIGFILQRTRLHGQRHRPNFP